jgi:hypothetical protein
LALLCAGVCKTVVDVNILTLYPSKLFKFLAERGEARLNYWVRLAPRS